MRSGNQAQRSPHAGDLRRRVTISESAERITGNGFQETMEREVATVWAGIIDGSGSERAGADAETVE